MVGIRTWNVFTMWIIQHLQYLLFLNSQTCPFRRISRAPLLYRGLQLIFSSPTFLEGYPKLIEELDGAFHATWYVGLNPDLLGVLCSHSWVPVYVRPLLPGNVLGSYFGLLVPLWKGVQMFLRYYYTMASNIIGIILPTLWSHLNLTKKLSWGNITFYLTVVIFMSPNLLLFCWVGEVKIEAKKEV